MGSQPSFQSFGSTDLELLVLPGRLRHFPSSGKRAPASGLEAGYWAKQTPSLTRMPFLMFLCKFSSSIPICSSKNQTLSAVLEIMNEEVVNL